MKIKTLVVAGLAMCLAAGCEKADTKKADKPVTFGEYAIQTPIHEGNVSIYPVTLASIRREVSIPTKPVPAQPVDEVATLNEARQNDWIVIKEANAYDFQIDGVSVTNKGPKRILLMAGELLVGGHQDRVVGADTIIEPGQTVQVPVYCVESGRSTGDTDIFTPADHSVPTSVKIAALGGDQEAVWSNVSSFNLGVGMRASGVTTVNAGLKMAEVKERQSSDYERLWGKLSSESNVVGAVVAIDGKILSLELFGSNGIFKRGMPTILRGAIAEGASQGPNRQGLNDLNAVATELKDLKREMDREMRRTKATGVTRRAFGSTSVSITHGGETHFVHSTYAFPGF